MQLLFSSKGTSSEALVNNNTHTNNVEIDSKEESSFLSMVLSSMKEGDEKGNFDEKIIKKIHEEKFKLSSKSKLDISEIMNKSLEMEKITLLQILQIMDSINGKDKPLKFPQFTLKLAKVLSNESSIKELKSAKSLHDLIKLSKKFDLGLEKLTITSKNIKEFEATFPALAKNSFFKSKSPIFPSEMLLNSKILKEIAKAKKSPFDSPKLKDLMKELDKTIIVDKKDNSKTLKKDKAQFASLKDNKAHENKQPKELPKINQPDSQDKMPKKNDSVNLKSLLSDPSILSKDTSKTTTLNDTKALDARKINEMSELQLKSNERKIETSSQSESTSSEQDFKENRQNYIIREIARAANSQIKENPLRQTFNQFSKDFKEEIENYKPPLSRVQLALNPKSLGEVEITIITRGSNLHVSFTSNPQTMNLFIQNQAEFKNSLVNMGFTQLEMNFSEQNQNKNQWETSKNSNKNQIDELSQEEDTLEIIIPKYV